MPKYCFSFNITTFKLSLRQPAITSQFANQLVDHSTKQESLMTDILKSFKHSNEASYYSDICGEVSIITTCALSVPLVVDKEEVTSNVRGAHLVAKPADHLANFFIIYYKLTNYFAVLIAVESRQRHHTSRTVYVRTNLQLSCYN